jgi:tetratricopeptide (TPR) repeat protein
LDEAQSRDDAIEFGRDNIDLRRSYLDTLVDSMLHSGRDPQQFERLAEKVAEHLSQHGPDKQLAEKLFQLLHARKLQEQGLDIIDELEPSAEGNVLLYWWLQSWRAQFLLSASQFEQAEDVASKGLSSLPESNGQVENRLLLELIQTAIAAISADEEAIQRLEQLAHQMGQAGIFPSTIARAHSYRAMGLSRLDRHEDARDAHERALQLCEEAGLVIELPTYLLNLGTAYHGQGQLGLAREYYARGVRTSTKLVRPSTRALLIANQANIDRSLGRLDEAESLVEQAHELAKSHDIQHVLTMCASIRGDIHADRKEYETALESYREPLESEKLAPTEIDETEAHLHLCETLLDLERYGDAQQHLEEARRLIREHDINDLRHYAQTLRARLEWNRHGRMGLMGGIEKFRKALIDSHHAGNHLFVIEQSPHLWKRLQTEELTDTQREIAELIGDAKGAIATGLTKELREDFYSHAPKTSTPDRQQGSNIEEKESLPPLRLSHPNETSNSSISSTECCLSTRSSCSATHLRVSGRGHWTLV